MLEYSSKINIMKNKYRRLGYDARDKQPNKAAISLHLCEKFIHQPAYQQAKTIMWYLHCRSEVQTLASVQLALNTNKTLVIPYCTKDKRGNPLLGLWHLQDLAELQQGTWGILEPPPQRWNESSKTISPQQLDLIMVPGVAFNQQGARLGNGMGYYDRLLAEVPADTQLTAVCYQSQIFEEIPMDSHDIYMDSIITEQAIYQGKGRV